MKRKRKRKIKDKKYDWLEDPMVLLARQTEIMEATDDAKLLFQIAMNLWMNLYDANNLIIEIKKEKSRIEKDHNIE